MNTLKEQTAADSEKIKSIESSFIYNDKAKILVHSELSTNVRTRIGNNEAPVAEKFAGVVIKKGKKPNVFLHALSEE